MTPKAQPAPPERVRAGRHTVEISRPDKVLFPGDGITKADLADYYRAVARRMVPHLRGRPLMLERHPDGIDGPAFMQKNAPDHFPDWVHRAELPKETGTVTYVICDDTATLLHLADQACTTPHRFLSKADRPEHPDRLVFDLDPTGEDFTPVRDAALGFRRLLDELELPSLLMTTGSRGLHVLVPSTAARPSTTYATSRAVSPASWPPANPTGSPPSPGRRPATDASTSTSGATPTGRPPSPLTPSAPAPALPSPPHCPGATSTTPTSPPDAGPSPPSTSCSRRTPGGTLPGPAPCEGPAACSPH